MTEKTLAESLAEEEELLRRRFIHRTRPKGPLNIKEAQELCKQMSGNDLESKK